MNKFDRIYALHHILRQARRPVSFETLQEKLEWSRATLNRIIKVMRDKFRAPLEYDRAANGYHYAKTGEHPFELPGLWFNAAELYALLSAQQLLTHIQPGLLDETIAPLLKRIEQILQSRYTSKDELSRRIRILSMASRATPGAHFGVVAHALLERQQLHIDYHARSNNTLSSRTLSPQRLTHYRDNWYLDAWCHLKQQLRSFSLDRIRTAQHLTQPSIDIPDTELNAHFATAYGIFAGVASHTAILLFTANRARWVADEQWHPEQHSRWLEDGRYQLEVPYSNDTELVMDIVKYGADVEVLEPLSLRERVIAVLTGALKIYQ